MCIRQLPNIITSLNIIIGCIGIVFAFDNYLHIASFCILAAAFLDFADGFSAKLLNAQSEFGKQLDSLADMVSFGILPATIVFLYFRSALQGGNINYYEWTAFTAYLIAVFSALRLAKFNIDTKQKNEFIGLPTPANAIFISSLPLIIEFSAENHFLYEIVNSLLNNSQFLLILTIISSTLLVSPIRMLSLKFQSFSFKENLSRYILIIFALTVFFIFGIISIPMIIIFYIILSLFIHIKFIK